MTQRVNRKSRLLSLVLSLVLLVGLLPGLAMRADAEGANEFCYAYDCQRSPAFPKQGESFTASKIINPKLNGSSAAAGAAGAWRLTSKGYYTSDLKNTLPGVGAYFDGVISNVAHTYSIQTSQVEVYELTKNGVHVAYGAIFARSTNVDVITTFLGDNWNNSGCTYLLSNVPLSGSKTVTIDQDLTTNAPPVHTHAWQANTTGNGSLAAETRITCTNSGCDLTVPLTVSLTASNVTLPGDVFSVQISPAPNARAASLPLTVSNTPGYKYSADGSNFQDIDPQTFPSKPGIYQASIVVTDPNAQNAQVENLYVKYTVSDPAVTAATGDNRPIGLMLVGLTAFTTMAAAAFLLDSRRKARF